MAHNGEQSKFPLPPPYAPSDAKLGAATHDVGDLRRKKHNKIILYMVLFAISHIGIIAIFSLTVMKVRTPKFLFRSAKVTSLTVGTRGNPSFSAAVTAELAVRNVNFGRYKYQNTTVEFFCRGASVGWATLLGSRAGMRSTKKFQIAADLKLGRNDRIASDLSAGKLPITSQARMSGMVEFLDVIKKKKSTVMNCSMEIMVATKKIANIVCR
ncbi:hypothetical protein OROGR_011025 [Orobanche gracilis]